MKEVGFSDEVAVEKWNSCYSAGTEVQLEDDRGDLHATKTRSEAWILGGVAVVMVEGRSGGYALSRITPKTEETA